MTKELTIIHLVSEQTLQNLLPILAFRPGRIVQVLSRERFQGQARGIESAIGVLRKQRAEFLDYAPEVVNHQLTERDPTPARVEAELSRWVREGAVVNYTGGTKMMSAAAFRLALDRGVRALYCDTSRRRFVWTPEEKPIGGLDFADLARLLTVSLLVTAHNPAHRDLHDTIPAPALIRFAKEAWGFKRHPTALFTNYLQALRGHFRTAKGQIPKSRSELDTLLAKPLPPCADTAVRDYLQAACRAGLLRESGPGLHPVCRGENKREIRNQLERISNLLEGSWLELLVVATLRECDDIRDVVWSLEPAHQQRQAVGETDVVCVDLTRLSLRVISCKESLRGRSPLEHMEALVQRTRSLGGLMARPTLAVLHVDDNQERDYRNWARILGIDLWAGDEIAFPFVDRRQDTGTNGGKLSS